MLELPLRQLKKPAPTPSVCGFTLDRADDPDSKCWGQKTLAGKRSQPEESTMGGTFVQNLSSFYSKDLKI